MKKVAFMALIIPLVGAFSLDESATEIVKKSDDKLRGKSNVVEMEIHIVRPTWKRSMAAKSWSKGTENSLILITSPARDKGTVFLKREKEIWNYVPTIERTIKLPPSMMMQSWMGTDFKNDDLVRESSMVNDYTLHVEVTKTEEPGFPWSELNTTPELERVMVGEMFEIKNVGHAPALDPKLIYQLSGAISETLELKSPLYGGRSFQEYIVPELEDYDLADVDYASNQLDEFFYVFQEAESRQDSTQIFQKINGVIFRVIKTPRDLADVTEVIAVNEIAMTFAYQSVKLEPYQMKWTQKFDSTLYYFDYADYLLTYQEAQDYLYPIEESLVVDRDADGVPDYVDKTIESIYQKLGNEPEFHAEGVSLISEEITIDVHDLHKGGNRSGFVNPDQILNPDGYVIIYLRLKKPTHGTYKLTIKANSEPVSEVMLETLIPDETEFIYPESLKYFETSVDTDHKSDTN